MALATKRSDGMAAAGQPVGLISYGFVILASYLAPGFFNDPQDAVMPSTLAAWPALFLALVALCAGFASVLALSERFPALRLVPVHRLVLGPLLGTLTAAAVLALAALLLRSTGDLISSMFLFLTPMPLVTMLTVAAAAYTAQPGVQTLGRALPVLVMFILGLGVAFLVLVTKEVIYPWTILPHAFPLKAGAMGALNVVYVLFGFQQILNLRPFLHRRDQRQAAKIAWLGFAMACFLLVGATAITLGTLTPQGTSLFLWATASVMRLVRVPGFFIARIGLAVLSGWSTVAFIYLTVHLWGQATSVRDLVGAPQEQSPWLVWVMAAAIWAVATWAWPDDLALLQFLHRMLDPAGAALLIALPLVMVGVAGAGRLSG